MFGIVRLMLGFLIWLFAICKKNRLQQVYRRNYYVFATLAVVALVTLSNLVPIENALLTFESPEAAYQYYNIGPQKIKLVVSGNQSDLVVAEKSNSDTHLIVPKTAEGWKLGIGIETTQVFEKVIDGAGIYLYHHKKTGDYYLVIVDTKGKELEITDSSNSEFLELNRENRVLGKEFWSYYAYVPNFNNKYWLRINGEIVWSQ